MVFANSSAVLSLLQIVSTFVPGLGATNTLLTSIDARAPSQPGDFFLRILPLGASITFGQKSSDGNGYRKVLRKQLRGEGWDVNMVGNSTAGTMKDSSMSGVPGFRIDQVHDLAIDSFKFQPNVVLLNAGTNDAMQDFDTENAPARMEELLDDLFLNVDGTTVVLSTLTISTTSQMKKFRPGYNDALREMVSRRQTEGESIVLAEMDDERITLDDMNEDGIHPKDSGYAVMADIWFGAINEAAELGLLRQPKPGVEDINKDD
jgi:lysophospholipase L1-like esterase